jgi:hypothetical protein
MYWTLEYKPTSSTPVDTNDNPQQYKYDEGIVHIGGSDRILGREEEED